MSTGRQGEQQAKRRYAEQLVRAYRLDQVAIDSLARWVANDRITFEDFKDLIRAVAPSCGVPAEWN